MKQFVKLTLIALIFFAFSPLYPLMAQVNTADSGKVVITDSGVAAQLPVLVDSSKIIPIQVVDSVKVSEPGGAMSPTEETTINWISGLIFFGSLIGAYYLGLLKNLTKWQSTLAGIAMGGLKFITDLGDAGTLWSMTPAQIFQSLTVALFGIIMKNLKEFVSTQAGPVGT